MTCERWHPLLSVWPLGAQYKEHRSHLPSWQKNTGAIASIYPSIYVGRNKKKISVSQIRKGPSRKERAHGQKERKRQEETRTRGNTLLAPISA